MRNELLKMLNKHTIATLLFFSIICYSCSEIDKWYFKEGGTLLWVDESLEDKAIKSAIKYTLENSSIIVAQIPWCPNDSNFFKNTAWYFSLAKDHGKSFMIAIDWQEVDRYGTKGGWSFANDETAALFKKDILKLVETFNPDFLNLGVEVNYYGLTSPDGFRAFATLFRQLKQDIKLLKPELKIGLSYQLELLYGHHNKWEQSQTFATIDNMLGDIDFLGVSTYPNMVSEIKQSDVLFSTNYLDSLCNAYSIPVGISETGVSSKLYNEDQRKAYIKNVFKKAGELDLKFVIWGSIIDATQNDLWYHKIGLLDNRGQPKKEFSIWQNENLNFYK